MLRERRELIAARELDEINSISSPGIVLTERNFSLVRVDFFRRHRRRRRRVTSIFSRVTPYRKPRLCPRMIHV